MAGLASHFPGLDPAQWTDLRGYCITGRWTLGGPCAICQGPADAVRQVDATHWTCATCGNEWETEPVDA